MIVMYLGILHKRFFEQFFFILELYINYNAFVFLDVVVWASIALLLFFYINIKCATHARCS
jgi:hypothetical protein